MQIQAVKTHRITINDSLEEILTNYIPQLAEASILVVTSKILAVLQGRVVAKNSISKYDLIIQEADAVLADSVAIHGCYLTIKNNILIPSAGIDESNAGDSYILYPNNIQQLAADIWRFLRNKFNLTKFGVLITDSHTSIMRPGVTGIALGWCGFSPLYSYIDQPDLYQKPLRVTKTNVIDALATSAVFVMGEGDEQTPLAIITAPPKINFLPRPPNAAEEASIKIAMIDDLYYPLLQHLQWVYPKKE